MIEQSKYDIIDMTISDYINLSSHIEASTLSFLKFSPKHFKNKHDEKRFASNDLIVSSALTFAVANPTLFSEKFLLWKDSMRPNKKEGYKNIANSIAKEEFFTSNAKKGITVLSKEQADKINTIRKIIKNEYPGIAKILSSKGDIEKTILWENDFGIKCKNRASLLSANRNFIVDIRIVENAGKPSFSKLAFDNYYPLQAYSQITAIKKIYNKTPAIHYLAIDTNEPHAMVLFIPDEEFIKRGEDDYETFNQRLKWCQEKNSYPGYEFYAEHNDDKTGVFMESLSLPGYASSNKKREVNEAFKLEQNESTAAE